MRNSVAGLTPACPATPQCAPPLLLILGPPASGKTLLAGQLATRYAALALLKDEIKEILFDTLGANGPAGLMDPAGDVGSAPPIAIAAAQRTAASAAGAWSRALSDASFALLFALAHRLQQCGRALLLEGNSRPGEHEPAIAALLADPGAPGVLEGALHGHAPPGPRIPLAQILCHARPETLIARLEARASDPARHRGHRDHDTAAQLRRAAPETDARFLALPGPQLRFDSEAPPDAELSRLYGVLDPWMVPVAR